MLPIPEPTPSHSRTSVPARDGSQDRALSPPAYTEATEKAPSPRIATQGLFISPPDEDEISPTLITSTLPSLLPPSSAETSSTTAFTRFGSTATSRIGGTQTSTAIHEQLSAQLETMAQQLKRNAVHFSNSLEKDKAVVEDAQIKLEGNYEVMQKERVRLRDHRGKSWGTTCMVVGIVLLVLLVFMLMVSVIRFS